MLTVYTYRTTRPANWFDLSSLPLDDLADHAANILAHQRNAKLWLGYIEGWMLTPQEETRLRGVLRAFPCAIVCAFPFALSQAWKNEIDIIYTSPEHGDSKTHDNGSAVQDGGSNQYGRFGASLAADLDNHQD